MLTLALTGDSIVHRRLLSTTEAEARELFDIVRGADVSFTNLEVLPNDFRGDPMMESGGSHFGAPSWVLDELAEAGFDLFAAATNHTMDYGISGMTAALEALEARTLTFAGIGRNLEDARRAAYFEHANGTVALISCCSTFGKGHQACDPRPDMQGRPGLSPLTLSTVYDVTPQQASFIRTLLVELGVSARRAERVKLGFLAEPAEGTIPFDDLLFREADSTATRTVAREQDIQAIERWIAEAKRLSDIVLVSIHSHEHGATKEDAPGFLVDAARRLVDAGASIVACHGPHLMRGMQLHRGCPIFYSLGNFIGQNELVMKIPTDGYARFGADPSLTPGMLYHLRTKGDTKGFTAQQKYWETVMPVLRFNDGKPVGAEIFPIDLRFGDAPHRRGRPRLAKGRLAEEILGRFFAMSRLDDGMVSVCQDRATIMFA